MMNRQTTSSFHAWRNVLIIVLLSCLIIGLPNFVLLTRYLPTITDARSLAGVEPRTVSEEAGHSSVSFTLDVYAHVLPSMKRSAAEKLENLLFANTGTQ